MCRVIFKSGLLRAINIHYVDFPVFITVRQELRSGCQPNDKGLQQDSAVPLTKTQNVSSCAKACRAETSHEYVDLDARRKPLFISSCDTE